MAATAPRVGKARVFRDRHCMVKPARHLSNAVFGETLDKFWGRRERNVILMLLTITVSLVLLELRL